MKCTIRIKKIRAHYRNDGIIRKSSEIRLENIHEIIVMAFGVILDMEMKNKMDTLIAQIIPNHLKTK